MADDSITLPGEIWKAVPGTPKCEVSDHGRVWADKRRGRAAGILSGTVIRRGERPKKIVVSIKIEGRQRSVSVHKLVLEAFIGPRPPGNECCHGDGNPLNNRLDNLRWDYPKGNRADAIRHGTAVMPPVPVGDRHYGAKLTAEDVRRLRALPRRPGDVKQWAAAYGVKMSTMSLALAGRTWKSA